MTYAAISQHDHDRDYSALLRAVRATFEAESAGQRALFRTDASGLFDLYLDSLPGERQVHDCRACQRFVETFGGLVSISEGGAAVPVMWNGEHAPDFYEPAFTQLAARVANARVTGVFLSSNVVWGTPVTGEWSHLSVEPSPALRYRGVALTPGQAMAAAQENYRTVIRALVEFTPPMLDEALRLLKAEALARSEKFVGPVEWLRKLHDRPKGRAGDNVLWRAIATAPEGYCHPRASVIGPLLADIADGLPFETVKRRFDEKLAPLQYQRPQVAPTAGNVRAAEALVEKLGLEPALHRRFARLEELPTFLWRPAPPPEKPAGGGVFSHLRVKDDDRIQPLDIPAQSVTWEKFARDVLPTATALEILVPSGAGSFIALTTAVNPEAPPILKWDREEERNPFAWYVYPGGSRCDQWGLSPGWARVTAVTPLPTLYGTRPSPFLHTGAVVIIEGAADSRQGGAALFPEILKDDLHAVRSTIEAYSKAGRLEGRGEADACGWDIRKGSANCVLRVTAANGGTAAYHVDRWD